MGVAGDQETEQARSLEARIGELKMTSNQTGLERRSSIEKDKE